MSGMVERVSAALAKMASNVWGCHSDCCCCHGVEAFECKSGVDIEDLALAAVEALGLTEVAPMHSEDFLALDPFLKGRPILRSVGRWGEHMWPQPDGKYRVFVMADDAALKGEG